MLAYALQDSCILILHFIVCGEIKLKNLKLLNGFYNGVAIVYQCILVMYIALRQNVCTWFTSCIHINH